MGGLCQWSECSLSFLRVCSGLASVALWVQFLFRAGHWCWAGWKSKKLVALRCGITILLLVSNLASFILNKQTFTWFTVTGFCRPTIFVDCQEYPHTRAPLYSVSGSAADFESRCRLDTWADISSIATSLDIHLYLFILSPLENHHWKYKHQSHPMWAEGWISFSLGHQVTRLALW